MKPRGTSKGLNYEDPLRDWISACRIRRRMWGNLMTAYMEALRGFIRGSASLVVEARRKK
ncbi:MAG: hypothetical protein QXG08_06230 [Candidatus Methanomethyliaceae archaeon]